MWTWPPTCCSVPPTTACSTAICPSRRRSSELSSSTSWPGSEPQRCARPPGAPGTSERCELFAFVGLRYATKRIGTASDTMDTTTDVFDTTTPGTPTLPPASRRDDPPRQSRRQVEPRRSDAGERPVPKAPSRRLARWRLPLILVASFMMVLDFSIVNVALPSIQRDLHLATSLEDWVVTAYAITFGGLLVLGGRAADLLGRRRMFTVGLALFSLASLSGGLASDPGLLLASRAVQGIGGAITLPAALSLITTG